MNYQQYLAYFQAIILKPSTENPAPYNNPDYYDYTRLNWQRMNRWMKTGGLLPELVAAVSGINTRQHWIIITEPWCGDAAHNISFIEMAAQKNDLIAVTYELREAEPFRINQYLTNGTRSIPKLIIKNLNGQDLGTWGPRPADCQILYSRLSREKAPFEQVKTEIQNWYNTNKGVDVQRELAELFDQLEESSKKAGPVG